MFTSPEGTPVCLSALATFFFEGNNGAKGRGGGKDMVGAANSIQKRRSTARLFLANKKEETALKKNVCYKFFVT